MLRAIIIDDEQKGIETLNLLIDKYISDVKVVAKSTNAIAAIELIESYKPEIIFLDINMPLLNGFELLEKLPHRDFYLIFTTAHEEYALRAIKSNAIDYLLKPIDYVELEIAVNKIKDHFRSDGQPTEIAYNQLLELAKQNQKHTLVLNTRFGIESLDINDIILLESQSNYTKISLNNSTTILCSKTLKEFEAQLCLPELSFMRVHHSFIINLKKVTRYLKHQENVVMIGNQQVPVSKSKKENFMRWLNI